MAHKRPLLPVDDRATLREMASRATAYREDSQTTKAYAQGVIDALRWLTGDDYDMSALLKEVTR